MWVFAIACGTCGVIGMAAGWVARGSWDKATRVIQTAPGKPIVTDEEWAQIVQTIEESK